MTRCRVCGTDCGKPIYRASAPAVTSMSTLLDVKTEAYSCNSCGHSQSPDLPDLAGYYDTDYKISLASDDHDQLYEMVEGQPVFRMAKQAELVLLHSNPPHGARVLDYGAAKAATLRAIMAKRPDIRPAVFDVSQDYRAYWTNWVAGDDQATYRCPEEWSGQFDLVTAHFVIEHVAQPVEVFQDIARLLAPQGEVFFTVPDVISNPGDLLVVDHVNHFTASSIDAALWQAGLVTESVTNDYRGAFVVVARKDTGIERAPSSQNISAKVIELRDIASFWTEARKTLLGAASEHGKRKAVIYGAGFYGLWISSVLAGRQRISGYLDQNPYVRQAAPVGPVFDPLDPPKGIEVVYAGLNPAIARHVLPEWLKSIGLSAQIVYLDGGA